MMSLNMEKGIDDCKLFEQSIIITNVEWVKIPGTKGVKRSPTTADIYTWDNSEGIYRCKKKVPWMRRFEMSVLK
jgi:hypothetical protein